MDGPIEKSRTAFSLDRMERAMRSRIRALLVSEDSGLFAPREFTEGQMEELTVLLRADDVPGAARFLRSCFQAANAEKTVMSLGRTVYFPKLWKWVCANATVADADILAIMLRQIGWATNCTESDAFIRSMLTPNSTPTAGILFARASENGWLRITSLLSCFLTNVEVTLPGGFDLVALFDSLTNIVLNMPFGTSYESPLRLFGLACEKIGPGSSPMIHRLFTRINRDAASPKTTFLEMVMACNDALLHKDIIMATTRWFLSEPCPTYMQYFVYVARLYDAPIWMGAFNALVAARVPRVPEMYLMAALAILCQPECLSRLHADFVAPILARPPPPTMIWLDVFTVLNKASLKETLSIEDAMKLTVGWTVPDSSSVPPAEFPHWNDYVVSLTLLRDKLSTLKV